MEDLHRVRPYVDPGFTRVIDSAGTHYLTPDGEAVTGEDLIRIRSLVLPPAWTNIWVSADPLGHIQAVGVDAKGRIQYRYHPEWTGVEADRKFQRAMRLARALPAARAQNTHHLRHPDEPRLRTLAVAFRFLDDAAPRIGSIAYLEENGSRGLTTLLRSNAAVLHRRVTLNFPAKEHKTDVLHMDDAELAEVVAALIIGDPAGLLLTYRYGSEDHRLTPEQVNTYLHDLTGEHFTAKDFRTVRGTIVAAQALARIGPVDNPRAQHRAEVEATKAAAEALANTPTVARSSYIDPRVFDAYEHGRTLSAGVPVDRAIRQLVGD